MSDPTSLGDLIRGFAARWVVPGAERAPLDPTRLGIPRQRLNTAIRRAVVARDGYTCQWCRASARRDRSLCLEVDHIVPWSAGGSDHPCNLRTLCEECNQARSNRITKVDHRALPIVWRCLDCEPGEVGTARTITAFCMVCRDIKDAAYVSDLLVGGHVPAAGVPAVLPGELDLATVPVMVRGLGKRRRFRDDPRMDAVRAELDARRSEDDS